MNRILLWSGAAALIVAGPALAADYNAVASVKAAQTWRQQEATLSSQESAARGVDVVASQPIPDTPANRARYGQPNSASGRLTKPIGD